jgi:hypothetical protein
MLDAESALGIQPILIVDFFFFLLQLAGPKGQATKYQLQTFLKREQKKVSDPISTSDDQLALR